MNQELQTMLSNLDAIAGTIDRELAAAEAFGPGGRTDLAMPHVNAAHDAVARFGLLLAGVAAWDRDGQGGAIKRNAMQQVSQPAAPAPAPAPASPTPQQPAAKGPNALEFLRFVRRGGTADLVGAQQYADEQFAGDLGALRAWFNTEQQGLGGQLVQGKDESNPAIARQMAEQGITPAALAEANRG